MSSGLSNLKMLAEGMKNEIDTQNTQLDRITGTYCFIIIILVIIIFCFVDYYFFNFFYYFQTKLIVQMPKYEIRICR